MGFMDNLRQRQFQQPMQQAQMPDLLQQAKNIVGNDPRAALAKMQDNGATVNLPNGKVVPVKDLVSMAEGKTAIQFLTELMT